VDESSYRQCGADTSLPLVSTGLAAAISEGDVGGSINVVREALILIGVGSEGSGINTRPVRPGPEGQYVPHPRGYLR
jgi:hypothetical protein